MVQKVFPSKRLCTLGKLFGLAPGETTVSILEKETRVSSIIGKHILLPFVGVMHSTPFDEQKTKVWSNMTSSFLRVVYLLNNISSIIHIVHRQHNVHTQ